VRSKKRKESHWHDNQPGGYDWISRTTRIAIYMRDEWKCLACGYHASPDEPAADGAHPWAGLTLDHLRRDVAKHHDPSNLVTLCLTCNSSRRHTDAATWNPVFAEVAYFQVTKPLDRPAALAIAKAMWPKRYAKQCEAQAKRRAAKAAA
jgi:5-methylcytosine-specific restriction endonuclease McrA